MKRGFSQKGIHLPGTGEGRPRWSVVVMQQMCWVFAATIVIVTKASRSQSGRFLTMVGEYRESLLRQNLNRFVRIKAEVRSG